MKTDKKKNVQNVTMLIFLFGKKIPENEELSAMNMLVKQLFGGLKWKTVKKKKMNFGGVMIFHWLNEKNSSGINEAH